MPEEPTDSGWLPPRPPDSGAWPRPQSTPPATSRSSSSEPRPAYVARGEYRPAERPPSSPPAVVGIVSGVAGIFLLLITGGLGFVLSIALGTIAYVGWLSAKRRVEAGQPGRPGQIRAALVLAVGALSLSVIAIVTWLVLNANGITPEDFRELLERERDRLQSR